MKAPEHVLSELVRQIVPVAHPLRIFLFGSAARGQWQTGSDLDLLIVVPDGANCRRVAGELYRRIKGVPVPYDLVVVTTSLLEKYAGTPGLVYRYAMTEGEELYAA